MRVCVLLCSDGAREKGKFARLSKYLIFYLNNLTYTRAQRWAPKCCIQKRFLNHTDLVAASAE